VRVGLSGLLDDEDSPDEDESDQEPTDWGTQKKARNTGMAVGYKGISVVLRGDRLGVFKATNDGKMELGGTVNQIKGPKDGKAFEPKKVSNISLSRSNNCSYWYFTGHVA
jgi:VID27 C-terminal WD40-like domain